MPDLNFFQEGSPYLNHPLLTAERTRKEIDFILSQIDIPHRGRILDVGCGSGRHSIELASRGFQVVGIDPSEAMIQAARARAEQAGVSPKFYQEYGENFATQEKFDAAICLFTTLGQIYDNIHDNTQLIQRTGNNLKYGGFFILEIPQRDWIIDNLRSHECFGEGSNFTEIFRSYTIESNIVTEKFDIHSPGKLKSYLLKYRVYALSEIEKMLSESKFLTLSTFGGYTETPLRPEDPNIVIVSQLQQ